MPLGVKASAINVPMANSIIQKNWFLAQTMIFVAGFQVDRDFNAAVNA